MGVTGLTENKLSIVKTLDPNEPYKVGVNGVLNVYSDPLGFDIVEYEIGDIFYKTYLPENNTNGEIKNYIVNNYSDYTSKREIVKPNTDKIYNAQLGNIKTKKTTGSVFNEKNILNINPEIRFKYGKKTSILPIRYKVTNFDNTTQGDTIFITKKFSYEQFNTSGVYKDDKYIGLTSLPVVDSQLFMERDQYSIIERHQRLSEINNLAELFTYRNGYYTEIKAF